MYGSPRFCRDEHGATTTEYAILIALIAIGLIAAVLAFQAGLVGSFENSADQVVDATSSSTGGSE